MLFSNNYLYRLTLHADGLPHTRPLLIFQGKEGIGNRNRQVEVKRYHTGVDVIWNPKGYCNTKVMLHWVKNQYKWGTPLPVSDNEPRLLVLDAFAPHKAKAKNANDKIEAALKDQIKEQLKKLNSTVSIIPGGTTNLLQPCDLTANSIIKMLIRQFEEEHYDAHIEEWKAGKFDVSERRVLMTFWVGKAVEQLHQLYRQSIITTFRQTGIALPPGGSADHELKIRGLEGIEIGDYSREEVIEIDGIL
jgi:hypothetical protein